MSNNTDEAVECIKVLVDNNRCGTCDSISGKRVRHQCGHCYCDDCLSKVEECLLCLTPPDATTHSPLPDSPAAQRATNAENLLNTFEEAFHVDVYKRSRTSEQLKVEKEVFPECIQAPLKYYNKRKSLLLDVNKENRKPSIFPGELTSPVKSVKMENSINYVHHWLSNNQNVTSKKSHRQPFTDLNINSPNVVKRKIHNSILDKAKDGTENTPKKRRPTNFRSALAVVENQSLLDTYLKPAGKNKVFQRAKQKYGKSMKRSVSKDLNKTDKDESGIVIDDDTIIIDETQSQQDGVIQEVDKDKQAWMAVLEADKRSPYVSQSLKLECSEVMKYFDVDTNVCANNNKKQTISCNNVPFYKRSYITETCNLCAMSSDIDTKYLTASYPKDVSITIENSRFTTTINISNVPEKVFFEKHSVTIQTDLYVSGNPDRPMNNPLPEKIIEVVVPTDESYPSAEHAKEIPSQDLFTAEMKSATTEKLKLATKATVNETAQLIVADSDSDDAANESSIIQVTAEVHHSSEQLEHGVLAELEQSGLHKRGKRSARGRTPNSTDSSDKENFDPNRAKRIKPDKKKQKKDS